jgi:hypothetical protein
MFSNVKSKTAVIAGIILTMVTLSAGQGFHLEWELDNLSMPPCLPSYYASDSRNTFGFLGQMTHTYNLGNEFDYTNDGSHAIIIPESDSTGGVKDIKIYNSESHSLIYTIKFTSFSKTISIGNFQCGFFDIDNDGTKELLIIPEGGGIQGAGLNYILFINVQTSAIKYEIDSVQLCGVYDLDHDGHPEFWCVKPSSGLSYSLQIWGSGATSVAPSSPSVAKKNLAKLLGNMPNPFTASTKIEYYVPEKQNVQLQIFSSDGRLLRSLVDGPQKMGEYAALWDGKTDNGQIMAMGSYYYRLKVGDFVSSKKMVELK